VLLRGPASGPGARYATVRMDPETPPLLPLAAIFGGIALLVAVDLAERLELDAAAARWKAQAADAARGFAQAVDSEFERWGLSAAKREIAMLLLKAVRLKDISQARGTSERTVRQQARRVYAKAGVAGRTELASCFLDALQ